MFRRLPTKLPEDVVFPADLAQLGYFVNDKDQIRQTVNPEQKYQYKINRSDRVNDVYKEAMNTCTRQIVHQRLLDLGLEELRLPLGASKTEQHVPILVSPDIATKKDVIVLFPDRQNDLGVLAYRVIGDEGVNTGSIIDLIKTILHGPTPPAKVDINDTADTAQGSGAATSAERPGIVVANPSQLIWYRRGGRAVTDREWLSLPRESAVHEAMRIDEVHNRVPGNKDFREHVLYVFENILSSAGDVPAICNLHAEFSIVGQEYVGSEVLHYLASNWMGWRNRINCVALINPQHALSELFTDYDLGKSGDVAEKQQVTNFIKRRTRAYRLSQRPMESLLSGRTRLGCNVYAAGETLYEENCFIRCWPSILDWIEMCRFSTTFAEPVFDIDASEDEGEMPKIKSPRNRKPPTEEEQLTARFHGDIDVTENGLITNAS